MKKEYQKPAESVLMTQFQRHILSQPSLNKANSNVGLKYQGGNTEDARSREFDFWDDSDE